MGMGPVWHSGKSIFAKVLHLILLIGEEDLKQVQQDRTVVFWREMEEEQRLWGGAPGEDDRSFHVSLREAAQQKAHLECLSKTSYMCVTNRSS